jgi:hypothetical protein
MEKCLDTETERFDAVVSVPENKIITSDFGRKNDLDLSTRENEFANKMFPLNIIFNPQEYSEWKQGCAEYYEYQSKLNRFLDLFNNDLWLAFQQYKVPVIRLSSKTPKEAVCQVFENVNTGGVSLTFFELMTATFAADDFQLRKDWKARKIQLKEQNALKGIDESSFLTAITLLTSFKKHQQSGKKTSVGCKRKDVLSLSLEEYQENADLITNGLQSAAKILAREKIFDKKNIPYQTQFIPLSAICA